MILVDTHVWIWWVTGSRALSPAQVAAINDADEIGLSVMSVWELCTKVANDRLELDRPLTDWLEVALRNSRLRVLPLELEVALESTRLPGEFHKDPADRFIVATSRLHGLQLLTSDRRILAYPHVLTIA